MKKAETLRGNGGFAAYEMVLLLASLIVFLAGVVLLVNVGVDAIQPDAAQRALVDEGERLLDDLEAIISGAQVISPASLGLGVQSSNESVVFAADLNGTGGNFEVSKSGNEAHAEGLQVIDIHCEIPKKLVAGVSEGGVEQEEVLLSDDMDERTDGAFTYRLLSSGDKEIDCNEAGYIGQQVSAVEVELILKMDGESRSFSREIRLVEPAPVAPIQ